MSETIALTQEELGALIASSCGRSVRTTYPGGKLLLGPDTRWCLPLIADMRGIPVSEELRAAMTEDKS